MYEERLQSAPLELSNLEDTIANRRFITLENDNFNSRFRVPVSSDSQIGRMSAEEQRGEERLLKLHTGTRRKAKYRIIRGR